MTKKNETKSEYVKSVEDVHNEVKERYLSPFSKLNEGNKLLKAMLNVYKKETGDKEPSVLDMIVYLDGNINGFLLPIAEENYLLGYSQGMNDAALATEALIGKANNEE